MNRRFLNPGQFASAESANGNGFEFAPEHDLANAGKPLPPAVELAPVGSPATIFEFSPENDLVSPQSGDLTVAEPQSDGEATILVALAALMEKWRWLSDEAKHEVVDDFVKGLTRSEVAKDVIHEIAKTLQAKS
jgi:hypothetical protein